MLDMESIWSMNEWMRSFWKVKTFLYCFLCYAYILWMYLKVLFRRKNFTKFHTKVCIWNEVGDKARTKNMYVHTYLVKKCLILAAKQKRSSCFQNGNVMLLWRVSLSAGITILEPRSSYFVLWTISQLLGAIWHNFFEESPRFLALGALSYDAKGYCN